MAGNIKGIIVEIGGDTSGLQKALSKVNSATSGLSKELRGVNSLLKLDPSNTELVAQKQVLLSKNIEETSEKLKLLKDIQKQADDAIANGIKISEENYRSLQREIANTENKLKTLQSQSSKWTTAGKAIEEFGNKITKVSDKVDKLGNTLTTSLTVPIVGLGTAAVVTGNNFEAQMSRVQAIAGATGEELDKLTEQAMQLGAETSFSATQVAEGMENLASAGFTTEEIMEAMPGLLDLAASSGADLATSSEIAASAIRGFGLEASEAGHVADVFAEAAAKTNAQTEDMGEAMKYIAPVANTMGLSIEEVAAAIGIMSDAGIKGEQAGTTLRGALTRLTKPTDKMTKVMEDLGVSFYDNEGKMKSLTEMVEMLQDATKDLTDEQEQNALTTLFGTESLSGMIALINRGSDDLDDITKSFEKADGAAENMADTMLDNTAGSLESLSGAIESAGIAIQKALSPEIRELSEWIQDLVNDFNNLSEEEQLNIIKTVALVAGIGPLVKILGTTGKFLGTVTTGIGTFTQAIGVATGKTTSEATAVNKLANAFKFLNTPMGIALTAMAGAVGIGLILADEQYAYVDAIGESTKQMEETMKTQQEFRDQQDDILNNTMTEIDNVSKLSNELQTLVDKNGKVKEGYEDRVSFILNELNSALGTEAKLNGNVIDSYDELIDSIEKLIQKKKIESILENEEAKYDEAIKNRTAAYDDMITKENELATAKEKVKEAQENLNNVDSRFGNLKGQYETQLKYAKAVQKQAEENLNNSKSMYQTYLNDIATYENDYSIMMTGTNEEINNLIASRTYTYQQSSADIGETINHNIEQVQYEVEQYRLAREQDLKNQDEINAEKNQKQIEAGEKQLANLTQQLISMTSTTEELTPQQIEAWKNLAQGSYSTYNEAVSKLAPEMQKKIQEATGVVIANTPEFKKQAGIMGEKVVGEFDKNSDAKQEALKTLQGYYEGLNDKEKNELLKKTVGNKADEVAKQFESGDYETSGKNVLRGIYNGLNNGTLGQSLINKAAGLAKKIANQFNIQWDEHSPSKLMQQKTEYLLEPISTVFSKKESKLIKDAKNLAKGIIKGFDSSFALNNDFIMPNMKSLDKLNNKVIDSTKTIFTTPTLNIYTQGEVNIRKIADEVNRIFGSKY